MAGKGQRASEVPDDKHTYVFFGALPAASAAFFLSLLDFGIVVEWMEGVEWI